MYTNANLTWMDFPPACIYKNKTHIIIEEGKFLVWKITRITKINL